MPIFNKRQKGEPKEKREHVFLSVGFLKTLSKIEIKNALSNVDGNTACIHFSWKRIVAFEHFPLLSSRKWALLDNQQI